MTGDVEFIKRCSANGAVFWSYHANMRLTRRSLNRREVLASVASCEIIEEYPADDPLPSCLCLSKDGDGQPIHFVVALDREAGNIRFVTVYRPDPDKWLPGFRERRKS